MRHPLNMDIKENTTVWVRGENGCGKSSLLKMIASILPYDSGTIHIPNHVSYLPHQLGLYDDLTIAEHDCYWGKPNAVFFTHKRSLKVGELSTGQRKKVALDYFFHRCGDVLLLDEPFSNLDYTTQQQLNDYLSTLPHKIILIAEHHAFSCFNALLDLDNGLYQGYEPKQPSRLNA